MKNLKKSWIIILAVALIFTIGAVSNVSASSIMQTVQAYQGVKIFYNGQQLTDEKQPYIINDTTYVPLRMLMENIGCDVTWDSANYRVIVTSSTQASLSAKDAQIANLENRITQLQAIIDELEDGSGADLEDIEEAIYDTFKDAGDDYFGDDNIEVSSITLNGDEDDIAYLIKLDFDNADNYDDLADLDEDDVEEFLDDVESEIYEEADGTDFEDADITGKLIDKDNSSYYVRYNGSQYTYSWGSGDDLDDIEDAICDTFEDAGDDYFDDDDLNIKISLDGDEDDVEYEVTIDFDSSDNYDDLSDVDEDDIDKFLDDLEKEIYDEIDDTDFEDAELTGTLYDNDDDDYYVECEDGDYDYSW